MKQSLAILLVTNSTETSASTTLSPLRRELAASNADVLHVVNCQQARKLLRTQPPLDLVITDLSLPDGNWCDILREVVEAGIDANILIKMASPDAGIWSEALWRGVYDILIEPQDARETRRVIDSVVRNRGWATGCSALAAAS